MSCPAPRDPFDPGREPDSATDMYGIGADRNFTGTLAQLSGEGRTEHSYRPFAVPFSGPGHAPAGRADRPVMGLGQQARIRSRRPSGRVHDHDGSDGAPTDPTHDTSGSANLGVRPTAATRAHPHRTSRTASSLPTSRTWSWPTSPATPSSRWPTPPSRGSDGSVMTSSWSGRSWPTPA
jgi:hypothetical protein